MSFAEINDLLEKENARFVILLCHHNADPDAICSAYAFSSLLKQSHPNTKVEIGATNGISRLSKHLLQHLPIEVETDPVVEKAHVIVLLDTNTILQLGSLSERVRNSKAPIIVIDHHASHPKTEHLARICMTQEKSSSTCEIIYDLFRQTGAKLDAHVAKALFLGIAFDTRHFILANSNTLKNVAELVDAGFNVRETLALLSLPMDISERIARLKASKRIELSKIGRWIIALSHVGAFQASSARALVELGAHVAVVSGEKNGAKEISLRSSQEFYKQTKIHLGKDVAKPVGEYLNGMGGGHATAAGINSDKDGEMGLQQCLLLLKEKLAKHN